MRWESGREQHRRAVDGLYDDIQSELYKIEYSLGQIGKMLDLMAGSQVIRLLAAEGPLLAQFIGRISARALYEQGQSA